MNRHGLVLLTFGRYVSLFETWSPNITLTVLSVYVKNVWLECMSEASSNYWYFRGVWVCQTF